jgi:hypothetical protein
VRFAHWQGRTSAKPTNGEVATGRGVTYIKCELTRTYVGAVADVEVNRKSGEVRVKHFAVVQDCGQIINPDGVRNQIEGNVIQTVSRTLKAELTFDRSRVTSLDWASYPILTFPEIPDVDIDLIDQPTEKPWGVGEPSAAVVPFAISNAVFEPWGCDCAPYPLRRPRCAPLCGAPERDYRLKEDAAQSASQPRRHRANPRAAGGVSGACVRGKVPARFRERGGEKHVQDAVFGVSRSEWSR